MKQGKTIRQLDMAVSMARAGNNVAFMCATDCIARQRMHVTMGRSLGATIFHARRTIVIGEGSIRFLVVNDIRGADQLRGTNNQPLYDTEFKNNAKPEVLAWIDEFCQLQQGR